MGGSGSNRWPGWYRRKTCVEDCLKIDAATFNRAGWFSSGTDKLGTYTWTLPKSGKQCSITVRANMTARPYVTLSYGLKRSTGTVDSFMEKVHLTTVPRFGDKISWLFTCPGCGRPVRCLYLPPRKDEFRCRHCHNLTYRKAQRHDKTRDKYRRNPLLLIQQLEQAIVRFEKILNGGRG